MCVCVFVCVFVELTQSRRLTPLTPGGYGFKFLAGARLHERRADHSRHLCHAGVPCGHPGIHQIYVYIYIYIYMYVCIHVCMYIHTYYVLIKPPMPYIASSPLCLLRGFASCLNFASQERTHYLLHPRRCVCFVFYVLFKFRFVREAAQGSPLLTSLSSP